MSDRPSADTSDWGFPAFAKTFPRDPGLDALVEAFARGDYAAVLRGVSAIEADPNASPEVKAAAAFLRARTRPDPYAKFLFAFALALLAVLGGYWLTQRP